MEKYGAMELKDAEELEVLKFYKQRVIPLYFIYKKISNTGILVDQFKRKSLIVKYGADLAESVEYLKNSIEPDENINWTTFNHSPKQIAYLVYDYLSCPEITHWKVDQSTGERRQVLSTDEESLEELILNRVKDEQIKKNSI
jgi:DNA polymerase I-like protein with 3'-5' exonuclease and polymerase domains